MGERAAPAAPGVARIPNRPYPSTPDAGPCPSIDSVPKALRLRPRLRPARAGPPSRSVHPRRRVPSRPAAAAGASQALQRLRAGDIDLSQYVDLKVHDATAHLTGIVSPAELDAVRAQLRDRMSSDPMLVDLVRSATGGAAEPPSDS